MDLHRRELLSGLESNSFESISTFFFVLEKHLRTKKTVWEQLSFLFYLMFPSLESLIRAIQIKKLRKELIFQMLQLCGRFIPEAQYKIFIKVHNLVLSNKVSLLHSREFLIK